MSYVAQVLQVPKAIIEVQRKAINKILRLPVPGLLQKFDGASSTKGASQMPLQRWQQHMKMACLPL
eukprot:4627854-Karenia_brevis.AAC.1